MLREDTPDEKFISILALIGVLVVIPAIIFIVEIYFFGGPDILAAIFT